MKIKKILILFLMLLYISIGCVINVEAAEKGKTYYNDSGSHNFTSDIVEQKEIATNTTFIHDSGYSTRSNNNIDQELFIMLQDSNASEGVKVVSWGGYNEEHTVSTALPRMTLAKIAEDYEKNHPGWKVVGGINADQYCWGYGVESTSGYDILENRPYYTMKADGENWFSHHFMGGVSTNLVGFLNDGNQQIVYNANVSEVTPIFKLNVYDENNNLLGKFDVNDMNPKTKLSGEYTYIYALTDTGNKTSPISRSLESKSVSISSSNDLYIVSKADKTWVGNSVDYSWFKTGVNSFFGKGLIDEVSKSTTLTSTQFAIETTNSELLKLIKKGCYVVAQNEIYGGYENCESAIGWHRVQRLNNVDNPVTAGDSYNNRAYPRSVVGVTNDGKIALITGQGTTKSGFYAQEINAVCKAYNIKTAFQMDGGGSVTMILRNEDGEFETVNQPSDGSDRSIYNGLFFVVKDVEAEVNVSKIEQNSIELDVNVSDYGVTGNVTNTYINLSYEAKNGTTFNESYEVIDGKAIATNLSSNVTYTYKIQYKVEGNDKLFTSYFSGKVTTAKMLPSIKEIKLEKVDTGLKVYISVNDTSKAIVGFLKISFDGGETYQNIQPNGSITLKDFIGDPFANILIKFNYNLNDNNGDKELETNEYILDYTVSIFMDSLVYNLEQSVLDVFNN